MTGDASLMYYCDACTAELAITLTRTAEGWVSDTADKQLAVEGWRTLTTADGVKVYCDGCGPDMTQAQRDDLVTQAARAEWNRQVEAELARLDAWNTAAFSFEAQL